MSTSASTSGSNEHVDLAGDLDTTIKQSSHWMATIVLYAVEAAMEASKCLMGELKLVSVDSVVKSKARKQTLKHFIFGKKEKSREE